MTNFLTKLIASILFLLLITSKTTAKNLSSSQIDSIFNHSMQLVYTDQDTATRNFEYCLDYYMKQKDTVKILEAKLALVSQFSGMGKYYQAYDLLWSTLSLLEDNRNINLKLSIYYKIASLYLLLEQYDKALIYHDEAIVLIEKHVVNANDRRKWIYEFKGFKSWLITETTKDFKQAEELLVERDEMIENKTFSDNQYLFNQLQFAQLYIDMNETEKALQILTKIIDNTGTAIMPMNSLLYDDLGQAYLQQKAYGSAIHNFEKSVEAIDMFQNHMDNKIRILESLSFCYEQTGKPVLALIRMKEAKKLGDRLFGSRSKQNKRMFEIKDSYSEQLRKRNEEVKSQRLAMLEKDQKIIRFRFIAYFAILAFAFFSLILYLRRQAHKLKMQNKLVVKEQSLEREKQAELIELKNKELTASALKLIERDTLLEGIDKQLHTLDSSVQKSPGVKQILQSIHINKDTHWKEFDMHFTAVNNDFYKSLKEKYPKLTPTDLKQCAFIKLGFSTKEMAQIMGIGIDGINTTRSRIRKKLGLQRGDNLMEFLLCFSSDSKNCLPD